MSVTVLQGAERLVLDVRNNGGGLFPAGVEVGRMLLDSGDIVLIADRWVLAGSASACVTCGSVQRVVWCGCSTLGPGASLGGCQVLQVPVRVMCESLGVVCDSKSQFTMKCTAMCLQ